MEKDEVIFNEYEGKIKRKEAMHQMQKNKPMLPVGIDQFDKLIRSGFLLCR